MTTNPTTDPTTTDENRTTDGNPTAASAGDGNKRSTQSTTDANGTAASARGEANIWPAFRYRDAKAAIAFLRSAFGFEVTAEYTNPKDPGLVDHAELTWPGGGGIMLGSARDDGSVMSDVGIASGSVYIAVDDVDALFDRAVAAGATVVSGPSEKDYGSRDFSVTDPEGVLWNFGTYRGAGRG